LFKERPPLHFFGTRLTRSGGGALSRALPRLTLFLVRRENQNFRDEFAPFRRVCSAKELKLVLALFEIKLRRSLQIGAEVFCPFLVFFFSFLWRISCVLAPSLALRSEITPTSTFLGKRFVRPLIPCPAAFRCIFLGQNNSTLPVVSLSHRRFCISPRLRKLDFFWDSLPTKLFAINFFFCPIGAGFFICPLLNRDLGHMNLVFADTMGFPACLVLKF